MHNLALFWILFGSATLTAFIWIAAASFALEYSRLKQVELLTNRLLIKRDDTIVTALVFTVFTIAQLILWLIS